MKYGYILYELRTGDGGSGSDWDGGCAILAKFSILCKLNLLKFKQQQQRNTTPNQTNAKQIGEWAFFRIQNLRKNGSFENGTIFSWNNNLTVNFHILHI